MKNIFKLLAIAVCVTTLGSCGGDDNKGKEPAPTPDVEVGVVIGTITGQWQVTDWSVDTEFKADVYLELKADMSFALYQNLNSQGYEKLSGTFVLGANNAISGQYSDGKSWGSSYTITKVMTNSMNWVTSSGTDTSIYTRKAIPEEVLRDTRASATEVAVRFL